uniref:tRNA-guanine(15) transglycosylase-like domain-containing protein n=1 Tax=Setaria digitata TaxID=48799 RepID=A0A915PH28_9BILA
MVKFVLERNTVNGRIGKIFGWGNVALEHETPSCMMYTRAGHVPHLTWDVASTYLKFRQPPIYQLTLPTLFEALPVIEKFGGGIARFASMPDGVPTHLTLTDPLMERSLKFNNGGNIAIWTKGGRRDLCFYFLMFCAIKAHMSPYFKCNETSGTVNVEAVKKLLKYSHVSSYETMFDYGTPEGCSNKRLEKALERTIRFSKELLRSDSCLVHFKLDSAALVALCGGHSALHHERCAEAIGSISKGSGFVLDVMQFGKRLRSLSKKPKAKKTLKMGGTETDTHLESSNNESSEDTDSLDPIIKESEFDGNIIKNLLAGVWPHISPSHIRLVNGAFSPTEVVTLTHLGVDLFDSSYAIFLAEQGKAFICDENFPQEATFSVLDFTDMLYSEDFEPLCKRCKCYTCSHYTRSYLRHLTNTKELLGPILLVIFYVPETAVMKKNSKTETVRDLRLDKRFDWVGPPDDISKIRPLRLRRLADETDQERKYREEREALNQWSSRFWAHHNILYEKKKAEFIEQRKKNLGRLEHSSTIDMSEFYKNFLDERYDSFTNYNRIPETTLLTIIYLCN